MEITRFNFTEHLPKIKEAIEAASFISIDGEFTGIASLRNQNHFDTPEERYQKLKEGSPNYLLIQFGLCTFFEDPKTQKYQYKAFNFYVFPRAFNRAAPDSIFLSQPSSLEFLISQGFDFNKLIKEGIPFLTTEAHIRLRERLIEKHKEQLKQATSSSTNNSASDPMPLPVEHKAFLTDLLDKISHMLESKGEMSLDVPPCNSFIRKLIYEHVRATYSAGEVMVSTHTNEKRQRYLKVSRCLSQEKMLEQLKEKQRQELEELEEAVGFSKVIEMISQSEKLVAGHNMLLDIINILRQFVCPLPEDYKEFKSLVKCAFNSIIDTKLLATSEIFRDAIHSTSLSELVLQMRNPPFHFPVIEPADGFPGYSFDSAKLHEAGFDAFITGVALIAMHSELCRLKKKADLLNAKSSILKPYINKIHMMQSQDIHCMDLEKDDKIPPRKHVFYVRFPKEWKQSDLVELFSSYGGIFISWLGDTSAFVSLKNPQLADNAYHDLIERKKSGICEKSQVSVVPYATHKKNQCNGDISQKNPSLSGTSCSPYSAKRFKSGTNHTQSSSCQETEGQSPDTNSEASQSNKRLKKKKSQPTSSHSEPKRPKTTEESSDWNSPPT